MSLIPFILELADELHEFNRCLATGGMDVDDFGFGIYPHELQPQQQQQQSPQQQQQQQSQHPLQQQQAQQQHLSPQQQQRRPRTLSQFYWLPNISKSRHHPYYRGKPCCNKTPIHLVHDHQLEKESSSTAGGGGGGGGVGGVTNSGSTTGITVGDKESTTTTAGAHATNSSSSSNAAGNSSAGKSAYSVVNKNGFQVSMNVKQFAPNELTVKTIDNCIVVEGQHEDKEDGHGVISRHFIRKYMLPKGYDPSEVLSTLSSDGILTVKAPPPALKTDETMERIVDIQQTGGTVQVQQSAAAAKEPANSVVASSGKEAQTSAAAAMVEQTVTATAAVAAGSLPTAVATTLQKQQQQPEPQQKQQKQQQPQQLSATVEGVQQQQQQPTKLSQATTTTKDLQVTCERNGKLEPNELHAEQETETRTAEQTATSSNTNNIAANNNNNNNNNNTNSNNNSEVTNMECSELKATVTSKATLQTEVQEQECAVEDAEPTLTVAVDDVNNKMPHTTDATKSSSRIDAIMADATADEPMETEEELEAVTKEEVLAQKPNEVSIPTAVVEEDTATANNTDAGVNSATATATTNNNTTSNDLVTPTNDAVGAVEANGIEINTTNNIDIELAPATITEASEIVLITNNGVSDDKTAPTGDDGLTISLETTVAEIDGVTDMDTDVAEVADAVDGVVDADGLDGAVIAIGVVDIGVGVDVNVITADGNNATAQNAEVVHEENLSAGNLVVAAQSPTPADLVAAADAAILLAKTQCDGGGAGDVAASKPALTTEEITN
ncbi:heat shock protein 67B1-like [Zeugodacus cucurbitae]|uniref:heat shock protein 67B1-like n=1 Tax=Zeugodacus cucurbitae TaxID=28588 RepID=UPI0023D916C8|nr:heat shock protein 67B1-like [Zeugodacus cucurbitae]